MRAILLASAILDLSPDRLYVVYDREISNSMDIQQK